MRQVRLLCCQTGVVFADAVGSRQLLYTAETPQVSLEKFSKLFGDETVHAGIEDSGHGGDENENRHQAIVDFHVNVR